MVFSSLMTRTQTTQRGNGLFVTGTSTDAGKTVISALLCWILAESGIKAAYFKPIQTGISFRKGRGVSPDVEFVRKTLADIPGFRSVSGALFRTAAAPVFAARMDRKPLSFKSVVSRTKKIHRNGEILVCEGAGGLAVPLDKDRKTMADLASRLGFPLVIVGPAGLGALNHFILTEAFATGKRLRTTAFFLVCQSRNPSLIETDNATVLKKRFPQVKTILVPRIEERGISVGLIPELVRKIGKQIPAPMIARWARG
jgi:dethiobiotin synthetase